MGELLKHRRPGPPRSNLDRDAAIIAAVSGGATVIGTAREWGISEARVRHIINRELTRRAAEEQVQQESQAGRCCAEAEAAVWKALADTARHRRRDCECPTCRRYRQAIGM